METLTKSHAEAEKLKYDLNTKKKIFEKVIKYQLKIPLIIYTINKNIPDLTQVIYLISKWIEVDKLIDLLRNKLEAPTEKSLCLKTEGSLDGCIVGDILVEELYEYERNRDGILYLVLDERS